MTAAKQRRITVSEASQARITASLGTNGLRTPERCDFGIHRDEPQGLTRFQFRHNPGMPPDSPSGLLGLRVCGRSRRLQGYELRRLEHGGAEQRRHLDPIRDDKARARNGGEP